MLAGHTHSKAKEEHMFGLETQPVSLNMSQIARELPRMQRTNLTELTISTSTINK